MRHTVQPKLIVGLGELLWDLLPTGSRLGGTISNFAVMAGRLRDHAVCASRVGSDDLGRQAREQLSGLPVDLSFLQTDPHYPTGTVVVRLQEGQPEYVIRAPVAWDFLELTGEWLALAERAEAVCFGTLAQRETVSRRAVEGFLAATRPACVRVFDVNLRPPFVSAAILEKSLASATVIKMNDHELFQVLDEIGAPKDESCPAPECLLEGARQLLSRFPAELVCITRGGNGSIMVTRSGVEQHPGIPTRVVDTVGAGDAFAAALTHYYLRQAPLALMSEAGNCWGSWVVSQAGAMPPLDDSVRESIRASILSRFAIRAGLSAKAWPIGSEHA